MSDANDPRPRQRVLVVDDNVEGCRALAKFLELSGYDVTSAIDGTSALRKLESEPPPDFLLTDLLLPDLDGRDIAAAALRLIPAPRIALITGWSMEFDPEEMSRTFDWILMKPVDMRALVGLLQATKSDSGTPQAP